jgi:minor extracellular serine protease Vpr
MVTLSSPPTASYEGGINGLAPTKPERGQKLDLDSPAVQAYIDHLNDAHQDFRSYLASKAPRAEIVREYHLVHNGFAVKLNGHRSDILRQGPGVNLVTPAALYRPTMNVSTGLIGADDLWPPSTEGRANAGDGIKIGIIDTGIVDTHRFFACKGDIPHKVYASGVAFDPSNTIVFDHGTHVAGTAAGCVITLGSDEAVVGDISGVAPGAELWDYNVFPGFGAGFVAFGGSAFSHDICAAIEDTVADGMDVINMSLGGGVQGPHDSLAECTNAAADAGVVPAVAAGNSGPGDSTVSSPGNAAGALTAGASTNPHFAGISVTVGSDTFGAALGDFNNFDPAITADYTVTDPTNGCDPISTDLTGQIALIDRGVCTFTTKVRNAQDAGAVGVLVVNNVAGDPVGMAHDGTDFPTIPAAMLGKAEGNAIKPSGMATVDGTTVTEFVTDNADIIAGFSSRGPTPFTFLIKPDVTAPGVNVYSSVFDDEFAFFQGTSMATPHVAGAAALLLDLHPDWSPADVKSALVNTAKRPVWDHVTGMDPTGVLTRGGGRIDLVPADDIPVTLDPASVSFGFWSGNKPVSATVDVSVRNVSEGGLTCVVGVASDDGAMVTASTDSITFAAGDVVTVTFFLDGGRSGQTPSGDYDADITLTCGSTILQAPWWVRIDREAKP